MADAADEPFVMFACLWLEPDGGAEKYQEYLDAVKPIIEEHMGGQAFVNNAYVPVEVVDGDLEPDLVVFNDYPSEAAFRDLLRDPRFQALEPLRDAGVERKHLVRLRKK